MGNWLVYLGDQYSTAFSVNSRAQPGKKLRITPGAPFAVDDGDKWMLDIPGMMSLYLIDFVPKTVRLPCPDETYLTRWEGAFLEGLASSTPDPARIVDLGTGKGASILRMLTALSLHQDAHVWTFDLAECTEALELIQKAQVPRWRYSVRISDSAEAVGLVPCEVDLVYVDASHNADGVRRDINAWHEKVKPGGIMAFHDYGDRRHLVTKPIAYWMKKYGWKRIGRVDSLIAFQKPKEQDDNDGSDVD